MTALELTTLAGVLVPLIVGLFVPVILYYRKKKLVLAGNQITADREQVLSWKDMNEVLKRDVDDLRAEMDGIRMKHRKEIQAVETDYNAQLDSARAHIHQLELALQEQSSLVRGLYERLGRQMPPTTGP